MSEKRWPECDVLQSLQNKPKFGEALRLASAGSESKRLTNLGQ